MHLHICTALDFIDLVRNVTLVSQFNPGELADFLNSEELKSTPPDDPNFKLSLLNYVSLIGSSQGVYKVICQNTQQCFPSTDLLSHYQVEQCV